jgi:hemoglobin/transferrin/lactoferrin receptor protein
MRSYAHALMAGSAIGMVLICLHSPALAQSEDNRTTVLKKITITGEDDESSPGTNKTTVKQDRIKQDGGRKLDDILRTISGVFTRENAQQAGVAVNVRGFEGSGRVNMSIDGVRQNFRFTGHEAAGFTYVDPNLLGGIDTTRGGVITTGGGALAGTVNFRTLGIDDVLAPGQQYGGLGRLSWGSNGVGFSEMLAGGVRYGVADFVGAISKRDSSDYKDGNGNVVADTGQDLVSGLFKANFGIGEDHTLSLGGVLYNNDFFANSYDQTVNNKTFTAKYRYDPDNDLIDLRINGYYNDLKMEYTGGTGSYVGRTITDRGAGFDVSNISLLSLGAVQIRSTTGVEYFHDDVSSENGGVNPGDGASSQGGVFSENTFSYGNFDLTAGLRYNFYALNGWGSLANYGDYDVDISKGSFDPKLTLAYNVTPWLQPYVAWSRSMRAPTLQETMLGGDHPGSTSGSYIPNPSLDPETQEGWELGVNIRKQGFLAPSDSLSLKANYFIMDVEDYIVASFNSTYGKYQFVNVEGTSKAQGFELEVSYDTGFVFAGISYTHSNSDLASQLPGLGASQYLPDDIVSMTGGARFLEDKLTVGARYSYVSGGLTAGYNSSWTGGEASEAGDPYHLVDVFTNYKFNEKVDVSFKVTNLFNESYTPFLSTTGTGQGRTFYLSTQVKF